MYINIALKQDEVTTNECNMLYGDYLDYLMKECFEINYKYSTAKRYKESFSNIKEELGNYKLSILTLYILNRAFVCAFLTACYTGMRTGEVFALTWDNIDLDNRIININKTVYAKDKEENGRWYLGITKTPSRKRKAYICDSLYTVLINYKNIQNNLKKQYGTKYKIYILKEVKNKLGKLVEYKIVESYSKNNRVAMVFTRKDGTYSGTDIIRYPFRIIHHKLGIDCRFYDLRGSFATISLRNSCEIKDIAEALGHKRIETTENYYITSTTNDLIKIYESIKKEIDINLSNKF